MKNLALNLHSKMMGSYYLVLGESLRLQLEAIMTENHVGICSEHEHDWCAIPLHEDEQICAKCGEITRSQTSDSFADVQPNPKQVKKSKKKRLARANG